jgi:hypothetical protein
MAEPLTLGPCAPPLVRRFARPAAFTVAGKRRNRASWPALRVPNQPARHPLGPRDLSVGFARHARLLAVHSAAMILQLTNRSNPCELEWHC